MQLVGHTGTVQRAVGGEAAAGSEDDKSVLKFLLLVPPAHGDILVQNGKTWFTFNEENIKVNCTNLCRRPSVYLQELFIFARTIPEIAKLVSVISFNRSRRWQSFSGSCNFSEL